VKNTANIINDAIDVPIIESATMRETVLESLPVDPALLESANVWFDRSWYGLLICGTGTALAAAATVGFLFVQYWSSGVKERHTEWRTSVVELETAKANKETEKLRDANLKLEAQVAPRRLTNDKMSEIARSLVTFEGKTVRLESYVLDAEAAILGKQIGAALDAAKLKLDAALMTSQSGGSIALGVHVTGENADLVKALLQALSEAGLATSPDDPNPAVGGMKTIITMGGRRPIPVDANVFVGVKPIE
jgi:hypothetical protein